MTDRHRDAITVQCVTAEHAEAKPDTTVSESHDDLAAEVRRLHGVNHALTVALDGANSKIRELIDLVEVEYAGRMRLAAIVREVRTHCAEVAEESEAAAYVLSILDGDPGPDWVYCGRGPCVLRDGHEGGCEL